MSASRVYGSNISLPSLDSLFSTEEEHPELPGVVLVWQCSSMAEHITRNDGVVGSIPTASSKTRRNFEIPAGFATFSLN